MDKQYKKSMQEQHNRPSINSFIKTYRHIENIVRIFYVPIFNKRIDARFNHFLFFIKKPLSRTNNSIIFVSCFLFFTSCTPDPAPTLNYKDREVVDSLFKMNVDSLRPFLDSIHDMRFDSAVQYKIDSMIDERQSEIDKYLERLRREQKNSGE